MPNSADRLPVMATVGQVIERDAPVTAADMMERAAAAALAAHPGLAGRIQRVSTLEVIFSPTGSAPASEVARRLRLDGAAVCELASSGGNTPQWLVNRAAADIAAGRLDATLIAGGEATRSFRAQGQEGGPAFRFQRLAETAAESEDHRADPRVGMGGPRRGRTTTPMPRSLERPAHGFSTFENALAAQAGRVPADQREFLGGVMAHFSAVAAGHPCAWFRSPLRAADISTVTADNRLIAEPYTKRMNAFPNVDQGAAVVVTSLALARQLGLDDDCVFVWSGANMSEPFNLAARSSFVASPAIEVAARRSFDAAGIGVDDVARFDLYSCFPSAVQISAAAVGIAVDDSRGLTVTGGLPYFGGPGSNYVTHAVATMVERLRGDGGVGMVAGLGGMANRHSIGVFGTEPPAHGFVLADTTEEQRALDATMVPVAEVATGSGTVEAFTVVYGRAGEAVAAPAIVRLPDGRRAMAEAVDEVLLDLAGRNIVGHAVDLLPGAKFCLRSGRGGG